MPAAFSLTHGRDCGIARLAGLDFETSHDDGAPHVQKNGGDGEIRTRDPVARMAAFQAAALDLSATSPAGKGCELVCTGAGVPARSRGTGRQAHAFCRLAKTRTLRRPLLAGLLTGSDGTAGA